MSNFIKIISRSISGITLLFAIFIPFVMNIFCSNTVLLDNRPLYEKPKVFSASFFKDYERYYNDTIACRSKLISLYLKLYHKIHLLTKGLYFDGAKDYRFYGGDRALKDYLGIDFKESEKILITNYINRNFNFCQKNNIKYLFLLMPNKEIVYSEFMPNNFKKDRISSISAASKLLHYFERNNIALNLTKELVNAKVNSKYPLYYKRDTHWNHWGAYIGFLKILNVLGYNFDIFKNPNITIINNGLVSDREMQFAEDMYKVDFLPNEKAQILKMDKNFVFIHYKIKRALINKKVLIFRDSFSECLMSYFSKVFSEVIFIHWKEVTNLIPEIEKYSPDIVIDQMTERQVLNRSKL